MVVDTGGFNLQWLTEMGEGVKKTEMGEDPSVPGHSSDEDAMGGGLRVDLRLEDQK
jgi:hypothetical protein